MSEKKNKKKKHQNPAFNFKFHMVTVLKFIKSCLLGQVSKRADPHHASFKSGSFLVPLKTSPGKFQGSRGKIWKWALLYFWNNNFVHERISLQQKIANVILLTYVLHVSDN